MPDSHLPATYRCAKCKRRVKESDAHCQICNWAVDLELARETAKYFKSKRNAHQIKKQRRMFIIFAMLTTLAILAVVLFVMAINAVIK